MVCGGDHGVARPRPATSSNNVATGQFFEFGFGCSLDERSLGQKTSFTDYNTIERRPLFRFDSSAVVGKVSDKLLFLANCVNQSWRFENINLLENDS